MDQILFKTYLSSTIPFLQVFDFFYIYLFISIRVEFSPKQWYTFTLTTNNQIAKRTASKRRTESEKNSSIPMKKSHPWHMTYSRGMWRVNEKDESFVFCFLCGVCDSEQYRNRLVNYSSLHYISNVWKGDSIFTSFSLKHWRVIPFDFQFNSIFPFSFNGLMHLFWSPEGRQISSLQNSSSFLFIRSSLVSAVLAQTLKTLFWSRKKCEYKPTKNPKRRVSVWRFRFFFLKNMKAGNKLEIVLETCIINTNKCLGIRCLVSTSTYKKCTFVSSLRCAFVKCVWEYWNWKSLHQTISYIYWSKVPWDRNNFNIFFLFFVRPYSW